MFAKHSFAVHFGANLLLQLHKFLKGHGTDFSSDVRLFNMCIVFKIPFVKFRDEQNLLARDHHVWPVH